MQNCILAMKPIQFLLQDSPEHLWRFLSSLPPHETSHPSKDLELWKEMRGFGVNELPDGALAALKFVRRFDWQAYLDIRMNP
jgi:hypothetical protein